MIQNAKDLDKSRMEKIANGISEISHRENSALLVKTPENIMQEIEKGNVFIYNNKALFTVIAENASNGWFELGGICNLKDDYQEERGRDIFPIMAKKLQEIYSDQKLYVTTTNIKMVKIATKAGFHYINRNEMPDDVREFCCSPCPIHKTGANYQGEQIYFCPRFIGDFIPQTGAKQLRQKCHIMLL